MVNKNIADAHHVIRHCKKRYLISFDGKVTDIFPEAFELRQVTKDGSPETYLSAIYFEHFTGTDAQIWSHCLSGLQFTPKKTDGLMKLNAGKLRSEGNKRSRKLRVTHEGKKACPAYAKIQGLPPAHSPDRSLEQLLAMIAKVDTRLVSTI